MFKEAQQWDKHLDLIPHNKVLLGKDWCQYTIATADFHTSCKLMQVKSPWPHQAALQLQAESPFMTFGATEESTPQDDACYFVDGSGNWFQFDN